MRFLEKGTDRILYLEVEQDLDMWRQGIMTFHTVDNNYLHFAKMENVIPTFIRDDYSGIKENQ
jgi:hypothetical protein